MTPFTPVGEQARWRQFYDVIRKRDVGDVVTYTELAEAAGLHSHSDRHIIQVSMRRAAQESLVVDNHALEAVIGEGYRIVQPEEHLRLARVHQRRSSRSLKRGSDVSEHVDLAGMDPEMQKAFRVVAAAFHMQQEFNRRLDVRQRRLEEAVSSMQETRERSDEEVASIRDRLERLERQLGPTPPN